jgi:hypothetical protein
MEFTKISLAANLVPDYVGKPASAESGWELEISSFGQVLASVPLGTISVSKTYSYARRLPVPKAEQQFFIGPVPLIASAEVTGTVGITLGFGYTFDEFAAYPTAGYLFGGSITPFANANLSLYAGVGTSLFSVGIFGTLEFFDEQLPFLAGTAIAVKDNGFSSGNVEFVVKQGLEIRNVFKGPQGTIGLYAKYTEPKVVTCNWGFIKGKCIKFKEKKKTYNLWRSPRAFVLDDVLWNNYDNNQQLDVVMLQGGSPLYFTL